ncbi:DNA ligase 1-like [Gigantopelta aegis]|uniref:DNA ligase 1-like n=1 Tax=Gigantopelta aegis TaxID=1735272 RepID=UPI001B88A778|nr:DNA ligase 1-like [Gigantopelta aegis]
MPDMNKTGMSDEDVDGTQEGMGTEAVADTELAEEGTRRSSDLVWKAMKKKQSLCTNVDENQELYEVRTDEDETGTADVESGHELASDFMHDETLKSDREEMNTNVMMEPDVPDDVVTDSTTSETHQQDHPDDANDNVEFLKKTNKIFKKGSFRDVVVDAIRFKYVFDEVENAKSDIPMIYTESKNKTSNENCDRQLDVVNENIEESSNHIEMGEDHMEDSKSEVVDEDKSSGAVRKESILSVFESTVDCKQEAPRSTLDDESEDFIHTMMKKEDCMSETDHTLLDMDDLDNKGFKENAGQWFNTEVDDLNDVDVDVDEHHARDAHSNISHVNSTSDFHSIVHSVQQLMRKSSRPDGKGLKQTVCSIEETDKLRSTENTEVLSKDNPSTASSGRKSKREKKNSKKTDSIVDDRHNNMSEQLDPDHPCADQQIESLGDLMTKKKSKRKKTKTDALASEQTGSHEDDNQKDVPGEDFDCPQEEGAHLKGRKSKNKISKHKTQVLNFKNDKQADDCQEGLAGNQDLTSATALDEKEKDDEQFRGAGVSNDLPLQNDVLDEFSKLPKVSEHAGNAKSTMKKTKKSKSGKSKDVTEPATEGTATSDCSSQQTKPIKDLPTKQAKAAKHSTEKSGKRRKKKEV